MTEDYSPYTNAIAERVNGILKQELLLEDYNVNIKIMKKMVDDVYVFTIRKGPIVRAI